MPTTTDDSGADLDTGGTDDAAAEDEEALGALFRGMPSLSPATRFSLAGRSSTASNDEVTRTEREASESKVMPLAMLFGHTPSTPSVGGGNNREEEKRPPRGGTSTPRRPKTPVQPASAASMVPDEATDRLEAIEESMRRIEATLEKLAAAQ